MNIFIEGTPFLELKDKIIYTKENAKKINIDDKTFQNPKYNNWYLVNGEAYYGKVLMDKEILNHLLCEKIASTIYKLKTVHFIPAKIMNKTGLASLNFREQGRNYFYANQDYFPFLNPRQTFIYLEQFFSFLNDSLYQKLVRDLLNLISFHIYAGLRDLIDCNLLFQKENGGFSLAPLYDFDFCFENGRLQKYHYKSSIYTFDLPGKDLDSFLDKYPEFGECLLKMESIDMEKFLSEIESEKHLFINDIYREYYLKQDEIKKDFIRSLHL